MKLFFTKNDQNDILVKYLSGTVTEEFSYVEMIKRLLVDNKFEDPDFNNLTVEEQAKIKAMLLKISEVFKPVNGGS